MTKETGTIADLNVKPGDVVRHSITLNEYEIREREPGVLANWSLQYHGWGVYVDKSEQTYTIVSRASQPDTPKLWRDMKPEEKGALLLAHHEGKVIEQYSAPSARCARGWFYRAHPSFMGNAAYRIRPEPKRETVTIYSGWPARGGWAQYRDDDDTHRITFDLIDGKPDCASIRMEGL